MMTLRHALWMGAGALGLTLAGASCGGGSSDMNNMAAAPTLTAIMPALGPTSGNTMLTLTGTNFTSGTTVQIGSTMATGVSFVSATQLIATLPAQSAFGKVPVTLARPDGQTVMRSDLFGYYAVSVDFAAGVANGTLSTPSAAVSGDFNGDGKLDLIVSNNGSSDLSPFLSSGSTALKAQANLSTGNVSAAALAAGDLNGDGKLDLAFISFLGKQVSVMLGNGSGGFGTPTPFDAGMRTRALQLADLNGDNKLDAVVVNDTLGVSVLLGNGTGGFGAAALTTANAGPTAVTVADFNGDGKLDLVVADGGVNNAAFLPGTGDGKFGTKTNVAVGTTSTGVVSGDFNGDGKLDLVFLGATGLIGAQGDGQGGFGTEMTVQAGINFYGVASADFNGDGIADLAAIDISNYMASVFIGSTTGLGSMKTYATGASPVALAVGDFNGDKRPDIGVANQDSMKSPFVTVLLNTAK
jgi:hypothetical protein